MTLSEPQLISPLLDGFVMGDPISEHDGIQCCPAMHLETSSKYIVKVISIPASQEKLDALLLAGAFTDKDSALTYFEELANSIVEEAALLQRLSRFEGFVSYESWQVVPMESGTGFDIYLLGTYRPTLDGLIKRNEMTHLGAVNLGLDLCAALSVARRYGHIYADLQPSNIYICNDREYRIGDLGFISLNSLQYASLPDRYRSNYTPNEIGDAYSSLNETLDTYAVGMILYQIYNDGRLPPISIQMQPPRYADPELSEIILKACSVNPDERWQEPMQMGQALISYLQRNTVNDVPIVPSAEEEIQTQEEEIAEDSEPTTEDLLAEVDEALDAAPALPISEDASEEMEDENNSSEGEAEEAEAEEAETEETEIEETEIEETEIEETEEAEAGEAAEEDGAADEDNQPSDADIPPVVTEDPVSSEEDEPADSNTEEDLEEKDDVPQEETAVSPSQETAEEESDDVAIMLAQADDIISHELPNPVIEVPPIELIMPDQAQEDETAAPEMPETDVSSESEEIQSAEQDDEDEPRKPRKGLIAILIAISAAAIILLGSILFYENYYLQYINELTLSGTEDRLTVTLDTSIADEKLTILCTDTYGNTMRRPVVNGMATFEGLRAGTTYKIQVRIEGFHKLLGETSDSHTTAPQTTISNFVAKTGSEDGSVVISFAIQGPDSTMWKVHYQTPGEQMQTVTFTGHMKSLTGLTVGKEYTFTLEPMTELYISGTDTIEYTPRKIIYAENLQILGIHNNVLHISWTSPEGVEINEWTVRCYDDAGYDQSLTTNELNILFENIDPSHPYTIEVTAEGMTVGKRAYLSANSITVQEILVQAPDRMQLNVQWTYEGSTPEGGWLLLYTVGKNTEQQVIECQDTSCVITPLIPGAHYSITVRPVDGNISVFNGTCEYDALGAPAFTGYGVSADDIRFEMCITPDVENWDRYDVPDKNYTTSFKVGSSASFVMRLVREYNTSSDVITTLYVIRDREGKVISNAYESRTWTSMWYKGYGKLTLPFLPSEPGDYTVWIYFNGTAVTNQSFEVLPTE